MVLDAKKQIDFVFWVITTNIQCLFLPILNVFYVGKLYKSKEGGLCIWRQIGSWTCFGLTINSHKHVIISSLVIYLVIGTKFYIKMV
jgi:hypothetical protein